MENSIKSSNFISSEDTDEENLMHSRSDNIGIMINDKTDEALEEIFQLLHSTYQIGLVTSMKGSDFIFHSVYLFILQMS